MKMRLLTAYDGFEGADAGLDDLQCAALVRKPKQKFQEVKDGRQIR